MKIALTPTGEGVTLAVRLQPRASKSGIVGVSDGVLRIRVTAPPVEGAANEALVRLLANRLEVAPSRIEIRSGERARNKVVLVHGVGVRHVAERLGIASAPGHDRR